jgi:diadenosine tetraphosphate (Ap4A) HIT family hydrolase
MPTNITHLDAESPFLNQQLWINENESAFALRDQYPVSRGHSLIVPKRTVSSLFELTEKEIADCWRLLQAEKEKLQREFSPDGFNVGVNIGAAAGQTIFHAHIHLIPRYQGDNPNPRGGIRAVVPGKADYNEAPG